MVELKKNSDLVENKIYDYLQKMLEQLKKVYKKKLHQLRVNYLELVKKGQQIAYH
jgi:hypothetical protein